MPTKVATHIFRLYMAYFKAIVLSQVLHLHDLLIRPLIIYNLETTYAKVPAPEYKQLTHS